MSRRANLLIFVLVSQALEHRGELAHVQVRPRGPPVCYCGRDSIGPRLIIDRLGIARYALRDGPNADDMARRESHGIVTCLLTRRNDI